MTAIEEPPSTKKWVGQALRRNPKPNEEEVRHALEGNLCRCTGYHNIVKAVLSAAEAS